MKGTEKKKVEIYMILIEMLFLLMSVYVSLWCDCIKKDKKAFHLFYGSIEMKLIGWIFAGKKG